MTHSKFDPVANKNDVALIQMYPSTDDGRCAVFGDTVQPACINQGEFHLLHNYDHLGYTEI